MSDFKHVDVLESKFVVQVVCGQQHTLCRAVDLPSSADSSSSSGSGEAAVDMSKVFVGSEIGADAYVWGNGVLGQLGIGEAQIIMSLYSSCLCMMIRSCLCVR